MDNQKIVTILRNIADLLTLQNDRFRPRAYQNAARSIEQLDEPLQDILAAGKLEEIPAVGKHIAKKIEELLTTGKLAYYQKLKKETKIDVEGLNAVPSLGPKKMKLLYDKLGIKNVKELEKAIKEKKIRELAGFTEKSEQNLLEGITLAKLQIQRFPYKEVQPIAKQLVKQLQKITDVQSVDIAGSFRRKESTIGDLDLLVVAKKPKPIMDWFTSQKIVIKILAKGLTKASVLLENNLQVDLRIVKPEQHGAALLYFTGNKQHNIRLRGYARKQGMTLNEYGLYNIETKKLVASKTEQEIYQALGLEYVKPEKRKN